MNEELYKQWHSQLAESIAENKIDEVNNLIAEPYFDELVKDRVKCRNLLYIAGVEHNHSDIIDILLAKMNHHRYIAADLIADVCAKGHLEIVKSLWHAQAFDANTIRLEQTLLLKACLSGNSDLVTFLIDNDAIPDRRSLNAACRAGALDTVKLLIEKGVGVSSINIPFEEDGNPFYSAIKNNRVEVLNYLLQHHKDKLGRVIELLPFICKTDNPGIVRVFVENGIDILSQNDVTNYGVQTSCLEEMLAQICRNGSIGLLDDVIKNIGNTVVNMPLRGRYQFPLLIASCYGNVDLFEQLLAHGADVCAVAIDGLTALHKACYANHIPIIQRLLVHGSKNDAFNVNAVDKNNNTALYYALTNSASEADTIHMIKQLVMHGIDININAPLIYAIIHCSLDTIKVLLDLTPNVNQKNSQHDFTALDAVMHRGEPEIVRRLLELDVDLNVVDALGFTPLMRAAQYDNFEIVTLLLQKGSIDSSKKNHDGNSAADFARSPEIRNLINRHVKLSQDADLSQGSSSSSRPPF